VKSRNAGAGFEFYRKKQKKQMAIVSPSANFLVRPAGFEPATYGFEVGFKVKTTGKDRQRKVN